jgi:hypothetical protein
MRGGFRWGKRRVSCSRGDDVIGRSAAVVGAVERRPPEGAAGRIARRSVPVSPTAKRLLALQRSAGNRATSAFVARRASTRGRRVLARGTYVQISQQTLVKGPTFRLDVLQRPGNQGDARDAIVDNFWTKGHDISEKEALLYQHAGGNAATAKSLLAKNWMSKNGAAVCHKLAISVFQQHLADWVANLFEDIIFGVAPTGDTEMTELVRQLTIGDSMHSARAWFASLVAYRNPPSPLVPKDFAYAKSIIAPVDGLCDALVRELNRSPDNLYIGDARANSTIQEAFDPHVPIDPANSADVPATPRSRGIYDAEHAFAAKYGKAPSSPLRQIDPTSGASMYGTSSINAHAGLLGYNFPPVGNRV